MVKLMLLTMKRRMKKKKSCERKKQKTYCYQQNRLTQFQLNCVFSQYSVVIKNFKKRFFISLINNYMTLCGKKATRFYFKQILFILLVKKNYKIQ